MIPGYVYLLENTERPGEYRVGRTAGLTSRLAVHARMFPMRLTWVICSNDSNRLEKHVKRLWAARCIGGEWFAPTADELAHFCRFANVAYPGGPAMPPPVEQALARRSLQRGRPDSYKFAIGCVPTRRGSE